MYRGSAASTVSDASECIAGFIHKPVGITLSPGWSPLTRIPRLCSKSPLRAAISPHARRHAGGERSNIVICLIVTFPVAGDRKRRGKKDEERLPPSIFFSQSKHPEEEVVCSRLSGQRQRRKVQREKMRSSQKWTGCVGGRAGQRRTKAESAKSLRLCLKGSYT